ncbi:MAG: fibronectin type III domain-containing protein [Bernardetiaceae bacterium]|nr:fibronectin type III domain-containing protein [Bernardetiaceae bacterium]
MIKKLSNYLGETLTILLLLFLFMGVSQAQTTDIVLWDFEGDTTDPITGTGTVDEGSTLGALGFAQGWIQATLSTGGRARTANNWSTGTLDNDKYFEFSTSTVGFSDIEFSFDERRSGTGIRDFEIHYSTDGTTFTPLPTTVTNVPDDTDWRFHDFDLSAITALNGQANLTFRIYGYNAATTAGTWRIDNVRFRAEVAVSALQLVAYEPISGATAPPDVEGPGVTGENLVRGAGLSLNAGFGFNSSGWTVGGDLATAKAADNYIEWGFSSSIAYNLTTLDMRYFRSGTGPASIVIELSVNGGPYTIIHTDDAVPSSAATSMLLAEHDISSFTDVTTANFRLYGFNATGGGGTFRTASTTAFDGTHGLIVSGVPSVVPVVTIAAWDFDDEDNIADDGIPPNDGIKTITNNATGIVSYPAGVTGQSISNTGWHDGDGTKYWEIEFVTTGYENLTLTSKQRSSNAGPRDFKVQYSLDGTAWVDVPDTDITVGNDWTTGLLPETDLPDAMDNQASVYLRWIMTSNTRVTGGTDVVSAVGTSRMEDLIVRGTPIPIATPTLNITEDLDPFLVTTIGTPSAEQSYTVEGSDMADDLLITAPAEFEISLTSGGPYSTTLTLDAATVNAGTTTIYVVYNPAAAPFGHTGDITHESTGAATINIAVEGQGITPIATARTLAHGTSVTISGTLTVSDQFNGPAYIQDATGGIAVFDNALHGAGLFSIGDSITITGTRSAFSEQEQLINLTSITDLGTATTPVVPQIITVSQLNDPAYIATLVQVVDAVFPEAGGILGGNSPIADASGTGELRINFSTSLFGNVQPDTCNVTGVVGRFFAIRQLMPRIDSDLPCEAAFEPPFPRPELCVEQNNSLDVVTWNIEWFGDPSRAPSDPATQRDSVRSILLSLNADVYAFQEITSRDLVDDLVSSMPGYDYVFSDAVSYPPVATEPTPASASQQLCFVYRTSVITPLDSRAMLETIHPFYNGGDASAIMDFPDADKNRFYAGGRLPFTMLAQVNINGVLDTLRFINIHARANSGADPLGRYNMRKYDVGVLEDTLRTHYGNDKIVFLGDYNDDIDETVANVAPITLTTYDAFMSRPDHYRGVTLPLSLAGFRSYPTRSNVIDHIIISNELFDNAIFESEWVHYEVYHGEYLTTTSDHLPVSSRLEIQALPPCSFAVTGATASTISLSWDDISNIETEYVLEFSLDGGTTWTAVPSSPLAANSTSYTHTGLEPETTYSYRLRAANTSHPTMTNASDWVEIIGTTAELVATGGGTSIGAPAEVAPATEFSAIAQDPYRILLTWRGSPDATRYSLFRRAQGESEWIRVAILSAGIREFLDENLTPDTGYRYSLRAIRDGSSAETFASEFTYPELPTAALLRPACTDNFIANIKAEGTHRGQRFNWYDVAEAGELLVQNMGTFQTPILSESKNYYVTAVGQKYESQTRVAVEVPLVETPMAIFTSFTLDSRQISCDETALLSLEDQGEGVVYHWLRAGRRMASTTEPQLEVNEGGVYAVVVNRQGCEATSDNIIVTLNYHPEARITNGELRFCQSGVLRAQAQPDATYEWFKNGESFATTTTNALEIDETADYSVKITQYGCEATSESRFAEVLPLPENVSLEVSNATLCPGENVILTATEVEGATYRWTRNGRPVGYSENNNQIERQGGGMYSVRISYPGFSCFSESETVEVVVLDMPIVRVLSDGSELVLTPERAEPIASISWYYEFGGVREALPELANQLRILPNKGTGFYGASVIYTNGCEVEAVANRYFAEGSITGNESESPIQDIRIYPNPTSGKVHIDLGTALRGEIKMRIVDALGRTLEVRRITAQSGENIIILNLAPYANGVYMLMIEADNATLSKKIIKE